MTAAKQLINAPPIPAVLYPARAERLTAIAPGVDCAMAAMSINSSSVKQRFFTTKNRRTMGTTTYPPPKVKALINRFVTKSHPYNFILCLTRIPPTATWPKGCPIAFPSVFPSISLVLQSVKCYNFIYPIYFIHVR